MVWSNDPSRQSDHFPRQSHWRYRPSMCASKLLGTGGLSNIIYIQTGCLLAGGISSWSPGIFLEHCAIYKRKVISPQLWCSLFSFTALRASIFSSTIHISLCLPLTSFKTFHTQEMPIYNHRLICSIPHHPSWGRVQNMHHKLSRATWTLPVLHGVPHPPVQPYRYIASPGLSEPTQNQLVPAGINSGHSHSQSIAWCRVERKGSDCDMALVTLSA